MKVKSESPTLSDRMDCSLPGSSIHGIFQARVLEWGAIAFSGMYLEKALIPKATCSPVVHSSTTHNNQDMKQPKYPSTEDWIKMWNIYTMKYYSATERNEIMPVCWSRGLNCPSLGGYASV